MKPTFMPSLFSPLTIRSVTFKNRIGVSPMCQYSSDDGFANDWHLVHLGSRAVGGAGLVLTEAAAISPEGRISPADLGIWKDEHVPMLKRITEFIEAQGSVPGIQLAHAGRKSSTEVSWKGGNPINEEQGGWRPIAPSALPFKAGHQVPIEMDHAAILKVIADFKAAAVRAFKGGFKVIELHAAHGYLLNEFLSPASNNRSDGYGGNFENRVKLLLEVIVAVRSVWPGDLPLFVRISATDYSDNGWTLENSVALAHILEGVGVDLLDCSSGGNIANVHIPLSPGYQVKFSEQIKKESKILTAAVGLITDVHQADEIITSGKADMVFLAREFIRDPYFPLQASWKLGVDLPWPAQYERGKPKKAT